MSHNLTAIRPATRSLSLNLAKDDQRRLMAFSGKPERPLAGSVTPLVFIEITTFTGSKTTLRCKNSLDKSRRQVQR